MKRLVLTALFTSWGLLALSTTACENPLRKLAARNEKDQEAGLQDVLAAEVRLTGTRRAAEMELSQLLKRAAIVPGVKQVAVVDVLPGATVLRHQVQIEREGSPSHLRPAGFVQVVSPGYFTTLKLGLRRGRFFSERDHEGNPLVVIVNESYASYQGISGNQEVIGRRVRIGGSAGSWLTIVGVVQDAPRDIHNAEVYIPLAQQAASSPPASWYVPPNAPAWYLLARVAGDREVVAAQLQKRLGREFRTLEESLKAHEPHDS